MFKRTKVSVGVLLAIGSAVAVTSMPVMSQETQRIEVTGSRIKRVDAEGALPITSYTRAELEATGVTTVAEFVRTLPFATAGNFRPQSGSSAAGYASADLRGLGAERTLILLDGRRLPKAPQVGSSSDMNSIPMAAIERVEVLTDGASAIYGSDAIGGVINFITRKDFEGANLTVGYTKPETDGGSKREVSAIIGLSGEKGRILGGFTNTKREMVFTSQRPWGQRLGATVFGNNAYVLSSGSYVPLPGPDGTCEGIGANFYTNSGGLCSFNFNAVAADEQQIENMAVFLRGEFQFTPDWSFFVNTSVSRVDSFGRYAPVPGAVSLDASSPANPLGEPILLLHRYAAAGNRDDYATNNLYDLGAGVRGVIADKIDVEFGARMTESVFKRLGYNYIVAASALTAINTGIVIGGTRYFYDPQDPYNADPQLLNAIKATISRDAIYNIKEVYANASMPLFKMGGGDAAGFVGIEFREEQYNDQYDSLSEAGQILGSAGNSAGGSRDVTALSGELLFPFSSVLEASLSARYEKYSDYGSDFSPKASVKFKAMPNLALRASIGKGFRAPSLDILTQKTTFSAESIEDPRTCAALPCTDNALQRDTFFTANPSLSSEQSDQFSVGAIWDVTPSLSLKVDYWSTKIEEVITTVGAQELVDRDNGDSALPIPAGLGVVRNTTTGAIQSILAGFANEGTLKTSGVDVNLEYRWASGSFGKFRHNLTYAHLLEQDLNGEDEAGLQGLPQDRITFVNNWSMGAFDVAWNFNYIGKHGTVLASGVDRRTDAYLTHDLQVNWAPPMVKGAKLTLGALNLGNKQPQLITWDGRNFNFYLYDSYGRQMYVRYSQSF